MRKGTRRILFWIAVIIFGGASWVAVLMAQGYKFDFSRRAFVRTGAVAVTVNVDATLTVQGTAADPMSYLSHITGMSRLLPTTYDIRVTKDGYSSWHKEAEVKEGLLTAFPSVLILPTDKAELADVLAEASKSLSETVTLVKATPAPTVSPKPKKPGLAIPKEVTVGGFTLREGVLYRTDRDPIEKVADGVTGLALSDDGSRILWFTRNELWVLWLDSTNYQPYRIAGDKELVTRFSVSIVRAAWFPDHDHIVVDLGSDGYRIVETDIRGGINIISL